jgi:hypothetical protein
MGFDEEWDIKWTDVSRVNNQLPEHPPFRVFQVNKLTCKLCGGSISYGTRWESDGWMCSTRGCRNCGSIHILTDSAKFCNACHKKDIACLSYPQIFIRESYV